jgi:exo-beta-1,3-glucanase (GH17 family)
MAIQPSDYIVKNKLGWYEGNIVKYITRHSVKGGRQDVEKVIHYAELLLENGYPKSKGEIRGEITRKYVKKINRESK